MILTVFRNRLRPGNVEEYHEWAGRISALAKTMPGYVSHKTFAAEDGERVTIVEFADLASQEAWSREARHLEAKRKGRADFYAEYRLQVCEVRRESAFTRPAEAAPDRTAGKSRPARAE